MRAITGWTGACRSTVLHVARALYAEMGQGASLYTPPTNGTLHKVATMFRSGHKAAPDDNKRNPVNMKRSRSTSPNPSSSVHLSSPIHELTSTFISAFSPSITPKALQALPSFATATHKICAWRRPSRQKSLTPTSKILYDEGHDDDGESWAGKRLSNVLRDTQTEGTVVVARWYGGQNIGPIRFTHIETCARDAIAHGKRAYEHDATAKKQKRDDDARRAALVVNLQERDYNIFALRKLLAEKKRRIEGGGKEQEAEAEAEAQTPRTMQAYESMGLDALRRVDKARDATIAFVLKQIDRADEELRLVESVLESEKEDIKEEGNEGVKKEIKEETEVTTSK